MSDTFPFAAGDGVDDDEPGPARRRPLLLAAGGLGVAALAVVGYLALTGPGEDDLALGLPTGAAAAAATPPPSALATPTAPASPAAVTAQVQRGRDPFRGPATTTGGRPGTATGGQTAEPAPAGEVPEPALPGPVDEGVAPVDVPVDPPALGEDPDVALSQVSLVRVTADQTAVLTVDGASQTVRVGDDFGPDGSLLLLSLQQGPDDGQWTAVVQRGSGEPFDVVTGSPALV